MRTFYVMLATAVVVGLIATVIVILSGGDEIPAPASRDTTTAVTGAAPDCASLTGPDREQCERNREASQPSK